LSATVDKRYQVFVSSTYDDLHAERQEVMQALLELDCMPAGMELFPAANDDQWTLIKRVIDDCDYYIVIIGGRYGSIGPSGLSYTQMEYEYAVSQDKPVIAFLHKEPGTLPANRSEQSAEGKKGLETFRGLAQQKMCKFWLSPADLGSAVSRSLVKLIKTNPAVGWVKADLLPSKNTTEEILRLRQKIEDLQVQLVESKQASGAGTEHLAQGDDEVQLGYSFAARNPKSYTDRLMYSGRFKITWNSLFARLSPLLIDEASDTNLRRALDELVVQETAGDVEATRKKAADEGRRLEGFALDDNDFNTIKVQFLALRLISKSTKRKTRSVSDKAAYWSLTPYGETVMVTLRAIPRPAAAANQAASGG
jgi:hypothetical protein